MHNRAKQPGADLHPIADLQKFHPQNGKEILLHEKGSKCTSWSQSLISVKHYGVDVKVKLDAAFNREVNSFVLL